MQGLSEQMVFQYGFGIKRAQIYFPGIHRHTLRVLTEEMDEQWATPNLNVLENWSHLFLDPP